LTRAAWDQTLGGANSNRPRRLIQTDSTDIVSLTTGGSYERGFRCFSRRIDTTQTTAKATPNARSGRKNQSNAGLAWGPGDPWWAQVTAGRKAPQRQLPSTRQTVSRTRTSFAPIALTFFEGFLTYASPCLDGFPVL